MYSGLYDVRMKPSSKIIFKQYLDKMFETCALNIFNTLQTTI